MSLEYKTEYKKGGSVAVKIEKRNNESYVRVSVCITKNVDQITNKIKANARTCLTHFLGSRIEANSMLYADKRSEPMTHAAESSPTDETNMSGDLQHGICVDVLLSVNETTNNILGRIEKVLFDALATHPDVTAQILENVFWITPRELKKRLGKRKVTSDPGRRLGKKSRNAKSHPTVDWGEVADALEGGNIQEAYALIGCTPVDPDLQKFLEKNRPTDQELHSRGKKWTTADGERLARQIILLVARRAASHYDNDDVTRVVQLAKDANS